MAATGILRLCLTLAASALAAGIAFAEPVTLERDVQLKSEPRADASVVATLKRGAQADAGTTKGPWVQLKSGSAAGWAFTFDVRYGSSQSASSAGGVSALASRLTSPQKPSITPTIGTRGLDPDQLRKAPFSEAQVAQLERYAASSEQARSGASASGLRAARIDYLDAK